MTRQLQIVIIGSSIASAAEAEAAEAAGKVVAELPAALISGGRGGVMEAASRGAKGAGGLVVGILPGNGFEEANSSCDIVIPTGIGYARNMSNVLAGDAVVIIGGASGTLSELAYAWQFGKPIYAWKGSGGVADEWAGKAVDMRRKGSIIPVESAAELKTALNNLLFDL